MTTKKIFIILVFLLSCNYFFAVSEDWQVYKLVYEYYQEKKEETNSLFLKENYSNDYPVKYMKKNFLKYNEEIIALLKSYTPDKNELTECLSLSCYFDESNSWVERFYSMGAEIKENMIRCALCHYPPYAIENCKFLLTHGYDLKKENNKLISFLLMECSYNNSHNLEIWKFFLENGLELNSKTDKNSFFDCIDKISDNEELVHLFVDSGFDYNQKIRGYSSFIDFMCAVSKNENIIKYLISLEPAEALLFDQLERDLNITSDRILQTNKNAVLDMENEIISKNLCVDSNDFIGIKWFLRDDKCVQISRIFNYYDCGEKYFYKQLYMSTNRFGNPIKIDESSYIWNSKDSNNKDICLSIVVKDYREYIFTIQYGHLK